MEAGSSLQLCIMNVHDRRSSIGMAVCGGSTGIHMLIW